MSVQNQQEAIKDHKEATENYIDFKLKEIENKIGTLIIESIISTNVHADKFSNSLLILSGAAITLTISNSSEVITALGVGSFKTFILFMVISAFFGVIAKCFHAYVTAILNLANGLREPFIKFYGEFDKFQSKRIKKFKIIDENLKIEPRTIDMKNVVESFSKNLPFFLKKSVTKSFSKGVESADGNKIYRTVSGMHFFQMASTLFQVLTAFIAFGAVIYGLN